MLATSDSLASYHLENVKLFSSNEEPQLLNPGKMSRTHPPCAFPRPCYMKVHSGQDPGELPASKRSEASLLSQTPQLSSHPTAASPSLPSSCLPPSHIISLSSGPTVYYVSGAQCRDMLPSDVQSWLKDKNTAQVTSFPESAA